MKEEQRKIKDKQRQQDVCASGSIIIDDTDTDTDAAVHERPYYYQSSGDEFNATLEAQADDIPCKRARVTTKQAVTPEIAAALNRTNVSNRKAAFILQAAAHSYGQ